MSLLQPDPMLDFVLSRICDFYTVNVEQVIRVAHVDRGRALRILHELEYFGYVSKSDFYGNRNVIAANIVCQPPAHNQCPSPGSPAPAASFHGARSHG